MRRKTLLHIVPEGWAVLVGLAAALLIVNAVAGFLPASPLLAALLIGILYFRDSPRNVPAEPLAVIAPVDGRVVHRRECYDPFLDREAVKLSLQLDLFGNYLIRSPVEGTVVELAGEAIEQLDGCASYIRTDEGDHLVMVVRDGRLFGQRPCRSSYGERVGQGRCCGMRRAARTLELYLPVNSRVEVELGDRVRSGECMLAKLVHKSGVGVDDTDAAT